jgi:short-subunit dehydrogenase
MELRGRSVLVTGATGGLGQAIARRLRAEGCELTLTGRREDVLQALAGEVQGEALVADLASDDDVQRVVDGCGDVDILVANAGVPGTGELTEYSLEQLDRVIDVNLRAPLALARLLGERMLARGRGHIVFMSSLSGKNATPLSSLYNATKFGLRGFALGLRQDWGPRGVGVSLVNPGPIGDAGMFHETGAALPAGFQPRTPADVAAAVVKAVKHDRAEVDVADPVMRAGAFFGQLAPQAAAKLNRLAGGDRLADETVDER